MRKCQFARRTMTGLFAVAVVALSVGLPAADAQYDAAVLATPGLVHYWQFNEAGPQPLTATDIVGGKTGTYTFGAGATAGASVNTVAGPRPDGGYYSGFDSANNAAQFSAANKNGLFMDSPDALGSQSFASGDVSAISMAMWFSEDSLATEGVIGGYVNNSGTRYVFTAQYLGNGGGVQVWAKDELGNQSRTRAIPLADTGWQYLVATWDGTNLRAYLNGGDDNGLAVSDASGALFPVENLVIGRDSPVVDSRYTTGAVDDFALFDRALTKPEVDSLYAAAAVQLNPPTPAPGSGYVATALATPGLVNYWRMSETSGTTAVDSIGGNDATYNQVAGTIYQLGRPGPGPKNGNPGFASDNQAVQFVHGAGQASLDAVNGAVLGNPVTGTPFADGISELTMSVWFKPISTGTGYVAGFQKDPGGARYAFSVTKNNTNDIRLFLQTDNGAQQAPSIRVWDSANDYDWSLLTMVWDGDNKNLLFYVNGQPVLDEIYSNLSANLATPANFNIGRDPIGNTRNLGGLVDELGLWDRALSASEVEQLYAAAQVPEPASATLLLLGVISLAGTRRISRRRVARS